MRRRSDLEKMRKRVDPRRGTLTPGGSPYIWVLPLDFYGLSHAEMSQQIQQTVRRIWQYMPPGHNLRMELVRDEKPILGAEEPNQIRFTAVRRDTSSLRDARWLSETPERTP